MKTVMMAALSFIFVSGMAINSSEAKQLPSNCIYERGSAEVKGREFTFRIECKSETPTETQIVSNIIRAGNLGVNFLGYVVPPQSGGTSHNTLEQQHCRAFERKGHNIKNIKLFLSCFGGTNPQGQPIVGHTHIDFDYLRVMEGPFGTVIISPQMVITGGSSNGYAPRPTPAPPRDEL